MGGGCFYPSCWVAAVHYLRKDRTERRRLAYIDLDAHKPDGIWKEVQHFQNTQIRRVAACDGVLFASIHVDGYPNPGGVEWTSARCVLAKGPQKAFEVRVNEELLKGVDEGGSASNSEVLDAFARWKGALAEDLEQFCPHALFIGLGFDLHKAEGRIMDKREGIGLVARDYKDILQGLAVGADPSGPVVLTLEGGYTRAAMIDGMSGALAGLVALSRARRKQCAVGRASKRLRGAEPLHAPSKSKAIAVIARRRLSLPSAGARGVASAEVAKTPASAQRSKARAKNVDTCNNATQKRQRARLGG